jgi:hypothetical protein
MSGKKAYLYLIALIVISACTKKQFAPLPAAEKHDKIVGDLACDPANPEFIHGNFNTVDICFNTITNPTDTFNNAYYRDNSIHLDHINMIRKNADRSMSCQLHFVNPDLRNKTLPYVLPHAAPSYNEYAEIVISDLNKLFATNIDEDYIGNTYKGFQVTITDTTGGYLTGNFNGIATTNSGKKVQVDNGEFYVKVIDVNHN